jgi:hypothetical protein
MTLGQQLKVEDAANTKEILDRITQDILMSH